MLATEPSLTVASLIDEILDVLHGYTRGQDQRTSLTSAVTATDLSFAVEDSGALSRGLVEIDDELVYVTQVDAATGMATIAPWGPGQSGTTASTHAAGAKVTQSPLYPRQRVASAVYGLLREIFPDVYAVGQSTLDINPVRTNYSLPGDCYHVLKVEWQLDLRGCGCRQAGGGRTRPPPQWSWSCCPLRGLALTVAASPTCGHLRRRLRARMTS